MNAQQLEDRASVAYWRKCAADRAGEVGPLKRLAVERFCEEYTRRLIPGADGKRTYSADCAVGSVRTLGLLAGEERDRAVVEIVWDGVRASEDGSGERRLEKQRSLRRSLFVFTRATGQQTSLDETFTTAHCQTCGAHDAGGTDPACAYCGAARTGNDSTWLLSALVEQGSDAWRGLRAELAAVDDGGGARTRPRPSAKQSVSGLLAWSVELVRADGYIDEKEELALRSLAEREGVSSEHLAALLAGEQSDAPEPRDEQESLAWLASLTELAMADGSISKAERRLLDHAGERLGLSGKERSRTTRDARMRLYKESREARRS